MRAPSISNYFQARHRCPFSGADAPSSVDRLRGSASVWASLAMGLCMHWVGVSDAKAQDMIRPSSSSFFNSDPSQRRSGVGSGYRPFGSSGASRNQMPIQPAQTPSPGQAERVPGGELFPDHGAASLFSPADETGVVPFRELGSREVSPFKPAESRLEGYLFKIGPAFFRVSASLRCEFNDNIDSSSTSRQSDLITTPTIELDGHWAISKINDLNLSLGIGYNAYLFHPELNSTSQTFSLTPGTQIAFKIKMGDVYFDFHERPQIGQGGQSGSDQLTAFSGLIYSSFTNDIGLSASWDLNDLTIQGGYQRTDEIPFSSDAKSANRSDSKEDANSQDQADREALDSLAHSVDSIFASATLRLSGDASVGLEGTASKITYSEGGKNNGLSYHAGIFFGEQLTNFITLRVAAGYQLMNFDSGETNLNSRSQNQNSGNLNRTLRSNSRESTQDSGDSGSPYANLELRHRVNRFFTQSLSIGYESDLGTTSNSVQRTYIRDEITWNITSALTLNVHAGYEIGKESGGISTDTLKMFNFGISTGYSLTRKLHMEAYYEFTDRAGGGDNEQLATNNLGGPAVGSYTNNRIGISFTYEF